MLHTHSHQSSGAGTKAQRTAADLPIGLSLATPQECKLKKLCYAMYCKYSLT
jgi:hypothetical protein